jgi:monovalent cation:H+ antiporter-2, CPA2 family
VIEQPLSLVLILLGATVFVVALARRLGWPAILGYLIVGMVLGPHALGAIAETGTVRLLAELGVVFLLFTLGLEFSLPRMMAMRREVFGLGAAQVVATSAVFALAARSFDVAWPMALVIGGAVAMSSTALILSQLTERAELNRTHGRLSFSMLLFQDLAFVPFLALASALPQGTEEFSLRVSGAAVAGGVLAVVLVLTVGRWLLRPLFHEIAHSRLRELFTLAVLLVVLGAAWVSHLAGLTLALGAFLAGMMLGETEYRHQIEAVIRPFRDILLGVFFISVGMLLDGRLLIEHLGAVLATLLVLVTLKAAIAALMTRLFVDSTFKAVRTSMVMSIGGEFGIALLTIASTSRMYDPELVQPLLVAIVLSMVLSPLILANNRRIARMLLGEKGRPVPTAVQREAAARDEIARRDHVVLCGFGRVGQNIARVLESQGFEYIALDLDPARIRAARLAGDPVLYGDSADEEMLERAGLANASAVVISFSNPGVALSILHCVRRVRAEVPILVRTQDDGRIAELKTAGATEVVPETFEASLMLVSHVLMLLRVPMSRVMSVLQEIRSNRYALLRTLVRREDPRPADDSHPDREELKSVVIPPGAWSVGHTLAQVRARGAEVTFTGVRRQGILGREPAGDTQIREGDIVVIYGLPEALEHAESVLLAG